jgi:hypothetical protein
MPPRPRLFAGLLAYQAHRKRRIARYQMLCRVTHSADRAFEFAMAPIRRRLGYPALLDRNA